jgi:hypothetical protein
MKSYLQKIFSQFLIAGILFACMVAGYAFAALTTFQPGTPIKSADVNANFSSLDDRVNKALPTQKGKLAYATILSGGNLLGPIPTFNSTGSDIKTATSGDGNYGVTFVNVAENGNYSFQCHVTAISDIANPRFCQVSPFSGPNVFPGTVGNDLQISVFCFDKTGTPANTAFNLMCLW